MLGEYYLLKKKTILLYKKEPLAVIWVTRKVCVWGELRKNEEKKKKERFCSCKLWISAIHDYAVALFQTLLCFTFVFIMPMFMPSVFLLNVNIPSFPISKHGIRALMIFEGPVFAEKSILKILLWFKCSFYKMAALFFHNFFHDHLKNQL